MGSKIEAIIFDMDGTLYQIDGKETGYSGSTLEASVKKNAHDFIMTRENCSKEEADVILVEALEDKVGISNFLGLRYGITRDEYFEIVWKIDPEGIVMNYEKAVEVMNQIRKKDLTLILLTAAPLVWQKTVLAYLEVENYFNEKYVGGSFRHKGEVFEKLAQRYEPKSVLSVGDQLETDIEPAAALGFLTLHVKSPNDLLRVLEILNNEENEESNR